MRCNSQILGCDTNGIARGEIGISLLRRTRLEGNIQHYRGQQTAAHNAFEYASHRK
jgi:hypothetical protein